MSNAKNGTLHMCSKTKPASTFQLIPYLLHKSVGPVSPTLQVDYPQNKLIALKT